MATDDGILVEWRRFRGDTCVSAEPGGCVSPRLFRTAVQVFLLVRPHNPRRPSNRNANSAAQLMGCGASKDGAGGVAGNSPGKHSDPMVTSLWRARPVSQASADWPRLIQAEGRRPELELALAGRRRANWPEPERPPVSHGRSSTLRDRRTTRV